VSRILELATPRVKGRPHTPLYANVTRAGTGPREDLTRERCLRPEGDAVDYPFDLGDWGRVFEVEVETLESAVGVDECHDDSQVLEVGEVRAGTAIARQPTRLKDEGAGAVWS